MMYEKETKFRPLIRMDTDGIEHAAMFMSLSEDKVKEHHKLYLMDVIPHYYRLCSSEFMTASECDVISVRCPICGAKMHPISAQQSGTRHALYCCTHCE